MMDEKVHLQTRSYAFISRAYFEDTGAVRECQLVADGFDNEVPALHAQILGAELLEGRGDRCITLASVLENPVAITN